MPKVKSSNEGHGRIRVFFAEIEGDNATIQQSLETFQAAVAKTFQPNIVHRISSTRFQTNQLNIESPIEVDATEEIVEEDVASELVQTRPPRAKTSKPPRLELVGELDFHPDGKQSLSDFLDEKLPKKQYEQVVAFVYYMQKVLQIPEISANHIYTCFKAALIPAPVHLPQVLSNVAKRLGLIESVGKNNWIVNVRGTNFVDHELPPSDR